jgi:hypothetical protein
MAGYYDRLDDQLAQATARGAGGWKTWRLRLPRIRMDVVALAFGVAAAVAVAAVFLGLGTTDHPGHEVAKPPVGSKVNSRQVIRNYAPGVAPALRGPMAWSAALRPPGGNGPRRGTVIVRDQSHIRYPLLITASGLPPTNPGGKGYAVWIVPAIRTPSGAIHVQGGTASGRGLSPLAELVGVVKPGPANGKLSAEGVIPAHANGADLLILTPAGRIPTRIILEAYIEF